MKNLLKIAICGIFISSFINFSSGKAIFKADFNKSLNAETESGTLKPVKSSNNQTAQGCGYRSSKGALFMFDNLTDFKKEKNGSCKPHDNLLWHLPEAIKLDSGKVEFMVKPYFNQISAYRNKKTGFKLYYMFIGLDNATRKKAIAAYILGKTFYLTFNLDNGKTTTLTFSVKDWPPEKWQKVTISWTPESKMLFINDKRKVVRKFAGTPAPFNIIMIGGASGGSNFQGVIDELLIDDTSLEVPKTEAVVKEEFGSTESYTKNWEIFGREGARFEAYIDKSQGHQKVGCLVLKKLNSKGYIQLRYRKTLKVKPGSRYQLRAFYLTDNAFLNNSGYFRIQDGKKGRLCYDPKINSGYIHSTFSQLINSGSGKWKKTLYYFAPQYQSNYYLNYVLRGSPCILRLDDIAGELFEKSNIMTNEPLKRKPREKIISEKELFSKLAMRKIPDIKIKYNGKYPRMYVNGKFYPQVLHRSPPLHPEIARFREMQDAGIKFHTLTIAVGGLERFSIIKSRGKYDFSKVDKSIKRLLRAAPDSYVILNFSCWPFKDWNEGNMGEVFQNRNGLYGVSGNLLYIDDFVKRKSASESYYPSYYATAWKKEISNCIKAYLKHIKKTQLIKAVGGFFITGGMDGQFMNKTVDYSKAARQAFSNWLRNKYSTISALRAAWNNRAANFEFKTPRELPDWPASRRTSTFLDPKTDTPYADLQEFRSAGILDTLNSIAKSVRQELGPDMPGYISICDDMNGTGIDTYSMADFCKQNYYNGLSPQPRYNYRCEGRVVHTTSVLDSLRIHKKFNILELDLRTYACNSIPSEVNKEYLSFAMTPVSFRNINRKLTGNQIAKGHGFWYYDMAASYFCDSALMKEIKTTFEITREVQKEKDVFTPGTALIFDEKSVFWSQHRTYIDAVYFNTNLMQMYTRTSGVPYDIYYLEDLLSGKVDASKYKMIVFLNAFRLTQAQRQKLDKLKNNHRTLVWIYAPGYVTEKSLSIQAISKLTGFPVKTKTGYGRHRCVPVKSDSKLSQNLEPVMGLVDMKRYSCDYRGIKYGKLWDIQRFWIDQVPEVIPLGKYEADGKTAIGLKKYPDWASVYVAVPCGLTAQLMNNLARYSGAYTLTKPGLVSAVRGNFVSVHAIKSGTYELNFPVAGKIVWIEKNQTLCEDSNSTTIKIKAGETRWYRIYKNK